MILAPNGMVVNGDSIFDPFSLSDLVRIEKNILEFVTKSIILD